MGFKKPFRAVPIRLGPRYRAIDRRQRRAIVLKTLLVAAVVGIIVGVGSVVAFPHHRKKSSI